MWRVEQREVPKKTLIKINLYKESYLAKVFLSSSFYGNYLEEEEEVIEPLLLFFINSEKRCERGQTQWTEPKLRSKTERVF